ncbi:hydroxysteroid 11-beta-dehydrogenase 1-like protein [Pangasianodon hypophthalmus]|uniref:hydroxysteroid 11-beta-dehydrogenase 1-like protein n=1 Tax=Pangasianodon hypophthalmus TaxID=310915 RepID=UPI002307E37C|nr:hydroxysteroid 11-beta-dehydrogenase 1-like protein [Pangasianodon hypophthalmus]XP_053094353.1 hydroxysteroid 11-beta-dehydrogenase 1-like protein [Pangasianodon hypophthalmus]
MKFPVKIFLFGSLSAALIALQWSSPTFSEESVKGMRVLVTGASTGIGEQVAYHYARMGAQIVITARREHVLKEVVKKCLDLGAQKALYIAADMAEISDAARAVEFAEKQLNGLDYLVLNHIGPSPYGMWDGDVDHVQWLMQVNFHSYVKMAVKALPALEKTNGSIIVVSSLLGKMCLPFALPYAATKFALNGFFGSLQHELAMKHSNVTVTICTLGLIDTESAMEKIKGYIDIPAYPAHEAAYQIIKAGALRQSEAFYPWYTYYSTLIRDWFPYYRDQVIRNSYNYQP